MYWRSVLNDLTVWRNYKVEKEKNCNNTSKWPLFLLFPDIQSHHFRSFLLLYIPWPTRRRKPRVTMGRSNPPIHTNEEISHMLSLWSKWYCHFSRFHIRKRYWCLCVWYDIHWTSLSLLRPSRSLLNVLYLPSSQMDKEWEIIYSVTKPTTCSSALPAFLGWSTVHNGLSCYR